MATTSKSLQADIGAKLSESSGLQKRTWKRAFLTTSLVDGFVLGKWISRQRTFADRSKLGDVQIPQLHGIGLRLSLLLGLQGQFVTAMASPGSGCGNSAFFAIPHWGQAQSDAGVKGSTGKKKRRTVKLFACSFLRALVLRFSYMIEQLTAAKSLPSQHLFDIFFTVEVSGVQQG